MTYNPVGSRDATFKLGLKPDSADVIIPALKIYPSVMPWGGIQKLSVPQIGLVDDMVRLIYVQRTKECPLKQKPV